MNKHRGYMREQVISRLMSVPYPTVRFCYFENGYLHQGHKSNHRCPHARMFRTLIRLQRARTICLTE